MMDAFADYRRLIGLERLSPDLAGGRVIELEVKPAVQNKIDFFEGLVPVGVSGLEVQGHANAVIVGGGENFRQISPRGGLFNVVALLSLQTRAGSVSGTRGMVTGSRMVTVVPTFT